GPDRVLVEIMPGFFNRQGGRLLEEKDLDGTLLQAHELARACRYGTNNWPLLGRLGLGRGLPCYRYAAELGQRLAFEDAAPAESRHGWLSFPAPTPEQRRVHIARALNQYGDYLRDFRLAPEPVKATRDLLALCRRQGIGAALVVPPEGTQFQALYAPAAFPAIDGLLADLRRDCGAPVFDARRWVADDDFWDTHHLLPSGAEAFTDRLG